ncbi:MAG: hypothetical protein AB1780_12675 [Pseudomonadota bacterium]
MTTTILSPKELLVVGELNYERGCFNNTYILDSSGCKYRVLKAEKLKWTLSPWNLFKAYRTIWVSLELSKPELQNIDTAREEILSLLFKNPEWYKKYDETERSLEEKLLAARTMSELISMISIYP